MTNQIKKVCVCRRLKLAQVGHKEYGRKSLYGQALNADTSLLRTVFRVPVGNVRPHIFFKFNPLNTDTFYRPPLVSVLTAFDCTVLERTDGRSRALYPPNQG